MHLDERVVRGPLARPKRLTHTARMPAARARRRRGRGCSPTITAVRRVGVERLERVGEDRRVGLADADLARDDDRREALARAPTRRASRAAGTTRRWSRAASAWSPARSSSAAAASVEGLVQAPALDRRSARRAPRASAASSIPWSRERAPPGLPAVLGRPLRAATRCRGSSPSKRHHSASHELIWIRLGVGMTRASRATARARARARRAASAARVELADAARA